MELDLNWNMAIAGAIIVVGAMEHVKGYFTKSSRWARVGAVLFSAAAAAAMFYLPPAVLLGLMILSLAQLGYQGIIEVAKKVIGKFGT